MEGGTFLVLYCELILLESQHDTLRSYTIQTPKNSIRRNRVHIKPVVPHPNLQRLDSTPLPSREPHPLNRNSPIASRTEENSNQSQSPVQTPVQSATETATPNETENPVSETSQVRPTPENTTSEISPEMTRTRTRIIKPPLRFRDYELT